MVNRREEESNVLHLTLEDDSELECQVLGLFEIEDKTYIALLPNGEEDVFLYEYLEDEEGIDLEQIETDEEFDLVAEAFYTLFVDEDDEE